MEPIFSESDTGINGVYEAILSFVVNGKIIALKYSQKNVMDYQKISMDFHGTTDGTPATEDEIKKKAKERQEGIEYLYKSMAKRIEFEKNLNT